MVHYIVYYIILVYKLSPSSQEKNQSLYYAENWAGARVQLVVESEYIVSVTWDISSWNRSTYYAGNKTGAYSLVVAFCGNRFFSSFLWCYISTFSTFKFNISFFIYNSDSMLRLYIFVNEGRHLFTDLLSWWVPWWGLPQVCVARGLFSRPPALTIPRCRWLTCHRSYFRQ